MSFLKETIQLRLSEDVVTKINDYMEKYPETWGNKNHFIRASVVWFINYLNTTKGKEFLKRSKDTNINMEDANDEI